MHFVHFAKCKKWGHARFFSPLPKIISSVRSKFGPGKKTLQFQQGGEIIYFKCLYFFDTLGEFEYFFPKTKVGEREEGVNTMSSSSFPSGHSRCSQGSSARNYNGLLLLLLPKFNMPSSSCLCVPLLRQEEEKEDVMLQRQGCHVGHYKKITKAATYAANAIYKRASV